MDSSDPQTLHVIKRDGTRCPLDINKIHNVLEWACYGYGDDSLRKIRGVSVSSIETRAQIKFTQGMRTKDIHEILIKTAEELISEETPNYDHVAARLRWFGVRKEAFGLVTPPHLHDIVRKNTKRGVYDPDVERMYSVQEWEQINGFMDHRRDDLFRLCGAEQMYKKYLAQNRKTGQVYETFQIPYILVAAILFSGYPKETRLQYVKNYYDLISQHIISLPTPIMAGLRTRVKQFSSCTLIDVADSRESIKQAACAIVDYASNKAGIGLNIGRIRAEKQPVRGGDTLSSGVVPFAKFFAAALKSCSQGGVRGASATFNWPIWHLEFSTLIELKNNKGVEETRLRTVDYVVHLNQLFYKRFIEKSHITFFSPEEVPDLYAAFYGDPEKFEELYLKYEKDPKKTKKRLPAVEVFSKLVSERFGTGRIYILNADHVNTHSSFLEPIVMTNLCTEITLPTTPMGDPDEMIALCTLSALNWGKIDSLDLMQTAADMAVRGLDALLDYQDYPNEAARRSAMRYRPLGVGIIGFAHYLAKNGLRWGDPAARLAVRQHMERMAFYLTETSIALAAEKAPCAPTKYHQGIFPIDTAFRKDITPTMPWEVLREKAKTVGIRNATLMALMPSETSSQLANETNGIEPPVSLVTMKGNKDVKSTQVVPEIQKLGHAYERAWSVNLDDYLAMVGELQVWIDQAISANTTYPPELVQAGVRASMLVNNLLTAYKAGVKTLYYSNVMDEEAAEPPDIGCGSDSCTI